MVQCTGNLIILSTIFTPQVRIDVSVSVQPAVELRIGFGIVVADDGLGVEIVLHGDDHEAEHDDEGGGLVVQLEHRTVHLDPRAGQEPAQQHLQWQSVLHAERSHA